MYPTKPPKFSEINKSALDLSFLNGFNDDDLSLIRTKQFPKLNINLTSVKVEDQTICWQPCLVLKCCTVLTPKKRVGWV